MTVNLKNAHLEELYTTARTFMSEKELKPFYNVGTGDFILDFFE